MIIILALVNNSQSLLRIISFWYLNFKRMFFFTTRHPYIKTSASVCVSSWTVRVWTQVAGVACRVGTRPGRSIRCHSTSDRDNSNIALLFWNRSYYATFDICNRRHFSFIEPSAILVLLSISFISTSPDLYTERGRRLNRLHNLNFIAEYKQNLYLHCHCHCASSLHRICFDN